MTEWITRREAAAILGVSTQTIDRYRDDGALTSRKIGRLVRLPRTEVLALLTEEAAAA
jgi:excisionase family DNA binding protein